MKLQFKAKIVDGFIRRPDLRLSHAVGETFSNELQFKMKVRRCWRNGAPWPPRVLQLDDLPENITVDGSGFLAVVTIDLTPPANP